MRQKFLLQHFLRAISPLIIMLLFCIPSIFLTWSYSTKETNKYNHDLLMLTKENIEQMLNESTILTNSLDGNVINRVALKELFYNNSYTYENIQTNNSLKGILNTPANVRDYIQSIYVYVDNPYSRCLVSNMGITSLSLLRDQAWYISYKNTDPKVMMWSERRQFNVYSYQKPLDVVTLYRRLDNVPGVIVLNMYTHSLSNTLDRLEMYPGQYIGVATNDGKNVFSNRNLSGIDFSQIIKYGETTGQYVKIGRSVYIASILGSKRYGWYFVSLVPSSSAYQVSYLLIGLMFAAVLVTVIIGLIIAFFQARRDYASLNRIIELFSAAESGEALQSCSQSTRSVYALISENIIQTFIAQNNLKIQLARQEAAKKSAELLALQSQLNPHFMFNTLQLIDLEMLAITKKPSVANRMISDLSEILRYALGQTDELVPFAAEIASTKRYVSILNYRYDEKFDVRWIFSPGIMDHLIMRLSLQPLVENAITHGIKSKKLGFMIYISIKHTGNSLRVTVLDTGGGMNRKLLREVRDRIYSQDSCGHIGLNNTNRRLILTYDADSHLRILSRQGRGTSVSFKIPFSPDASVHPATGQQQAAAASDIPSIYP